MESLLKGKGQAVEAGRSAGKRDAYLLSWERTVGAGEISCRGWARKEQA